MPATTPTATVTLPIVGLPKLAPKNTATWWTPKVAYSLLGVLVFLVLVGFAIFMIARFTNPAAPLQITCADHTVASSQGECDARAEANRQKAEAERLLRENREAEARRQQERRDAEAQREAERREADAKRERDRLQDELNRERNRQQPVVQPTVYTPAPPLVIQQSTPAPSSRRYAYGCTADGTRVVGRGTNPCACTIDVAVGQKCPVIRNDPNYHGG